jgi:chromosome segregation ATPase
VDPAIVVPVLLAVIAPIGAYLLAARKMSGKIGTSDATELWRESKSIRDDYRTRISGLVERIRELELRSDKLEDMNTVLVRENNRLATKVTELEELVTSLRKTITSLENVITAQEKELEK